MKKSRKSNPENTPKKKILVSACLYGHCVRYDGASQLFRDKDFLEWKNRGMLVPVCPEVLGGLCVPREPCEICGKRVISKSGTDTTEAYERGAAETLKLAKHNNVLFAILKDGSPSCGSRTIHDGSFSGKKINGVGICTRLLLENGIVVIPETDITSAKILLNDK